MNRDRDTFDMFAPPDRGRLGDNEGDDQRGNDGRVTGASNLIDLALFLHAETKSGLKDAGAIRVSQFGEDARSFWLPKSQVEFSDSGRKGANCQIVNVTMPNWLAKDKGLI